MRLIALLLAVMMMTGAAAQVCASPDVASAVSAADDLPDLALLGAPEPVTVARPIHPAILQLAPPPAPAPGRPHAVLIFRPPR